jgi:SAM-dependent methyltransferase
MPEHDYAPNLDTVLDEIEAGGNYTAWIVERARPHLHGRVLDAGAGTGTFSAAIAAFVDEVVALEPEPRFVDELERRFADEPRIHVAQGDVEAPPGDLGTFDAIICFNVLEHVRDDARALRTLNGMLRPGGSLLLLVPAHPALTGPFDHAVGHMRRYRRGELASRLVDAGFRVDTARYVNPVGAIGWAIRIRLMRRREWPTTSFKTFDRLVPIFRPLDRLRLPFGLSVWIVAKP